MGPGGQACPAQHLSTWSLACHLMWISSSLEGTVSWPHVETWAYFKQVQEVTSDVGGRALEEGHFAQSGKSS